MNRILKSSTILIIGMVLSLQALAAELYFENEIHDPSTILKEGAMHWTFGTGDGIISRYSDDLYSWNIGEPVFPVGTWPSWINSLGNFDGSFWAPDIIEMGGKYYCYYSVLVTINGGTGWRSAIGVAVTESLNNPSWQDLGMVVSSVDEPLTNQGQLVHCIDAGLFRDENNKVWMVFGSHQGGIFMYEIDPSTAKTIGPRYGIIGNNGNFLPYSEAAQITYINNFYYVFWNLGQCCEGNQSTYNIVVGRASSPTGPYFDKDGNNLWQSVDANYTGGSSAILQTEGKYIGPGHYGYFNNNGQDLVSIHYYDGTTADGWPARLDLLEMNFVNGWPEFTRNFTINGFAPPTPVTANLTDNGVFKIVANHSSKNLGVQRSPNGSCPIAGNGTNVNQESTGDDCEQWLFKKVDDHYWSIHPTLNTSVGLDVTGFSQADGGNVQTWDYWGGSAQQFRLIDLGNGQYQVKARHSGKVLEIDNGSTADGANLVQWTADQSKLNQQFTFVPLGGGGGIGSTVHVNSIITGTEGAGAGNKRGTATIQVFDDLGNGIESAEIFGTFSGTFNESVSGFTASDGTVVLKTTGTAKGAVSVELCVDDVIHSSLPYEPSDNIITCTSGAGARFSITGNLDETDLIVFPNPVTNNQFQIVLPQSEVLNADFRLVDISGKEMMKGSLNQLQTEIIIPQGLKRGVYFLRLNNSGVNFETKIVID